MSAACSARTLVAVASLKRLAILERNMRTIQFVAEAGPIGQDKDYQNDDNELRHTTLLMISWR